MTPDDAGADMKKYPTDGAHDRARTLRRTMTDAERRIWLFLRARQINGFRFRRQVPIGGCIADFVCHEARLIIEIDGGQHDAKAPGEIARSRFSFGHQRACSLSAGYSAPPPKFGRTALPFHSLCEPGPRSIL